MRQSDGAQSDDRRNPLAMLADRAMRPLIANQPARVRRRKIVRPEGGAGFRAASPARPPGSVVYPAPGSFR